MQESEGQKPDWLGFNWDPSIVFMSLHHHEEDLALKSPVTTDKDGFRLFMSIKRFSKLDKNKSN